MEETSYGVIGEMPDGSMMEFASESDYENAYYDMLAELHEEREYDWPEDWIA